MSNDNDSNPVRIADLIKKYLSGEASPQELLELELWKSYDIKNQELWNDLINQDLLERETRKLPNEHRKQLQWTRLNSRIQKQGPFYRSAKSATFFKAVAIFLVVIGFAGACFFYFNTNKQSEVAAVKASIDPPVPPKIKSKSLVKIKPGKSKDKQVILLLSNNKSIVLNAESNTTFEDTDGTSITNTNGNLNYLAGTASARPIYNQVRTPEGLTYQLTLSDGTKVWLSTKTSIRYPTVFTESERVVEMEGEAYFEVAHDSDQPFIVKTSKSKIKVLGTKFNVKAYKEDTADKTSLLSGSVTVSGVSQEKAVTIEPGYEASVFDKDPVIQKANVADAIAWKEGLFVFDNKTLDELMHDLSKWYNLSYRFSKPELKSYHFTGRLKRTEKIDELLKIIAQAAGIEFSLNRDGMILIH